ncbi:GNAT family N-acetyltransferase [Streptomyces sp. NBC_00638]|uniref:GNAT family N-acetyltransferase n=1 Tax=Streptomyces sp. NBC_00638 TaxID=2975794 RepID=UPI002257A9EB|nr:GNAT family N-acetyltransferase [Streptomyces sp. NBC_00638]MCX5006684.1 GNAT family N-acetyltransferase [Streptomyces sp. NBC_00638]
MTWVRSGARGGTSFRLDRVSSQRPERALEIVLLAPGQHAVGRLRFQVCPDCRTGRILDIWVSEDWQRQGLGREAQRSLLALHPAHRWTTTTQSRQGRSFFTAMARETQTGFPAAGPLCPHLRGRFGRLTHRVLASFMPT